MKNLLIVIVFAITMSTTGCSLPIQLAADFAGDMAASALEKSTEPSAPSMSNPDMVLGQELERHQINQFEVRVSDGSYKEQPCIYFVVYEKNKLMTAIAYLKSNAQSMQAIKNYEGKSSEIEKKQFVKTLFLSKYNFDLGPIESETEITETAEKLPTIPSTPSFSVPSFAPATH